MILRNHEGLSESAKQTLAQDDTSTSTSLIRSTLRTHEKTMEDVLIPNGTSASIMRETMRNLGTFETTRSHKADTNTGSHPHQHEASQETTDY